MAQRQKKWCINIVRATRRYPLRLTGIRDSALCALRLCRVPAGVLTIMLVDATSMRRLHKHYLNDGAATDVMTFPLELGAVSRRTRDGHARRLLGDIVVSLEQAASNARRFGTVFRHEVVLYVIHGILHLMGYDDQTPSQRIRMERRQQQLLARCCRGV